MSLSDNEDTTGFSKASTAIAEDSFISSSNDLNEAPDVLNVPPKEIKKKFLGGYKHKLTGITYYNVATQTVKPPWNRMTTELFCRDSQTVETKDQIQQTSRDVATQVQVRNLFMQNSNDKSVSSTDNYVYADEIQTAYIKKVIFVQKYVRVWLAKKELKQRQKCLLDKLEWEKEQRKHRDKQDSEWLKDVQKRKLYPIKEDDFLLLFSDLQNWWESEAQEISETKTGTAQQEALWDLVNEEAKKISEINKVKATVENQKVFNERNKKLVLAGKPKLWKAYKKDIAVITGTTQRGQNLQDLYLTLSMKCISTQDRIDALHTLIKLLQKNNNNLINTLLQLAQREVDLLLRGTKVQNLEGLRSRIQDLFWQYVKQPMFNPHIRSQTKLKKTDGKEAYVLCCSGCKQFFSLPLSTVNEVVGKNIMGSCFLKCKKCLYLENEGWVRKDTELYKKILKLLIEEEEKRPSVCSIIYILQPFDIKHLVEAIWKRQSCLSGFTDLKELEFVRYNVEEKWTPWNCMLVTREEAAILSGVPNARDSYDDQFKKFIYQRHLAARGYFEKIPRFLPYVMKSTLNKDYDSSSDDDNI